MTNQELAEHLRSIETDLAGLDPARVVEVAASKNHPLHNRFEWDDRKAGHEWRVHQARHLIGLARTVVVIHSVEVSIPSYVEDPQDFGYRRVDSFTKDDDSARQVVLRAAKVSLGHLTRVQHLSGALLDGGLEYSGVIRKMNALIASLE